MSQDQQHPFRVHTETRELPPANGWREVEATGQARATCPCGLDTGYIPVADAWATARTHGNA